MPKRVVTYSLIVVLLLSLSIAFVNAQKPGTCVNPSGVKYCGQKSGVSSCYCDAVCEKNKDCCADYKEVCGTPICGDSKVNQLNEQCDRNDFDGKTCEKFDYEGGKLSCNPDCTISTQNCTIAVCGDSKVNQPNEFCDGKDFDGITCQKFGYARGKLICNTADCTISTLNCTPIGCGDRVINQSNEQCDSSNLGGKSCKELGYAGGKLVCNPDCKFNTANCIPKGCGDGILQTGEQCDNNNLGGKSCKELGYSYGKLSCADCTFNTTNCVPVGCADGIVQANEQCDGNNLGGKFCEKLGYAGGKLSCNPDCTFNTANCTPARCGDGFSNQLEEECDKNDFNGVSCTDLGFSGGKLSCTDCKISTSNCNPPACGDSFVNQPNEQCDGFRFAGDSCKKRGYTGGKLFCNLDCTTSTHFCTNETKCTDSDHGRKYNVKGVSSDYGTQGYVEDICRDDGITLIEYSCTKIDSKGKPVLNREEYKCPNGCKDGACIKEKPVITKQDFIDYINKSVVGASITKEEALNYAINKCHGGYSPITGSAITIMPII